jgi:hypothetical protein
VDLEANLTRALRLEAATDPAPDLPWSEIRRLGAAVRERTLSRSARAWLPWAGGGVAVLALSGAVLAAAAVLTVSATYFYGSQKETANQTVTLSQAEANAAASDLTFVQPAGLPVESQLAQVQESTPGSSPFLVTLTYSLGQSQFSISEGPAPSQGTPFGVQFWINAASAPHPPAVSSPHWTSEPANHAGPAAGPRGVNQMSGVVDGTVVSVIGQLTRAQEGSILQAMGG